MLSAVPMFRRVARALRYAVREEDFLSVLGAGAGLLPTRKPTRLSCSMTAG